MSPLNSILINQYGWLFLFKLTLQRRPLTTGTCLFPPRYSKSFCKQTQQIASAGKKKKKQKTQCAGILPLSKCHVLNKLKVAIQPIDRFRCGFLHTYNRWHCYAACPPKTWSPLHISHSHYQLLSCSSDRHLILLRPAHLPVPWQPEGASGFLQTQTISSWMKPDVSDLGPIIYDTVTAKFLEKVAENFFFFNLW